MTSIQHNDPDETIKPMDEDNDPPFSLPDVSAGDPTSDTFGRQPEEDELDPTHPATDNEENIDVHEQYDEGLSAAAEASEPNAGNDVADYNPTEENEEES